MTAWDTLPTTELPPPVSCRSRTSLHTSEKADLFLQPSLGDAFPVAVLEAMLAGLPVVVTETVGVKEILAPEFISPVTTKGIVHTVDTLLEKNPDSRNNIGHENRKAVSELTEENQARHFKNAVQKYCTMTRNVALIILDTVRKDYFDKHAPRLTALSDVSFSECRAASSWSTPSHASIMTGELPSQHGVHTHNKSFTTIDPNTAFTAELSHHTACISANAFASTEFGFDQFFDDFISVSTDKYFPDGKNIKWWIHNREEEGLPDFLHSSRWLSPQTVHSKRSGMDLYSKPGRCSNKHQSRPHLQKVQVGCVLTLERSPTMNHSFCS
ncbi:glycosyltransferase [Natronoarchaeum sp. GCM10025703]|uniref:glycosyltransferase n=1 Tax=Natronoarchaeum sp. GCM10025703 TaxID=3252685 RepID=UPI0036183AE2